uniref:Replication protein A subunit n=2 Tax=Macrostomum lignano TaxID=282301 RepID=A0A1I8H497_9PLAT
MSDLDSMLSRGSVRALSNGEDYQNPVLKVLGHRKVPGGGQDRYRLFVTDGVEQHSYMLLGTQLNYLIENGELLPGTVLRLTKYVINKTKADKQILIGISLEILGMGSEPDQFLIEPEASTQKPLADSNRPAGFATLQETPPRPTHSGFSSGANFISQTPPHSGRSFGGGSSDQSAGSGIDTSRVRPISSLNPYQNKWTVCGRVTQKSQVRTWSNSRGEGKLFSFVLTDDSSEIRVTAFRDEVDKYFDLVELGRAMYISRGQLKAANKQFNNTQNEYEMVLSSESQLQQCDDADAAAVPEMKFNFVPIAQLDTVEPNKFVDVCGVVHETHDVQTIVGKTSNREIAKRDLTLVDSSGCSVRCTLWGDEAVKFNGEKKPVVAVKGAKVSDFGGRSLSSTTNSCFLINPSMPEADRLRGWYHMEGQQMQFDTFRGDGGAGGGPGGGSAVYRNLKDCKAGGFGTGDKFEYFSCLACIIHMKRETCLYQACPKPDCNKKVIEFNGEYRCEKCQSSYPNFTWRFLLQANLADHTDNQWVTCFQDTAEKLLGVTAQQLGQMRSDGDDKGQTGVFEKALFQHHLFTMRAKMENFQDEMRLRVVVQDVKQMNFAEAGRLLVSQIEAMAV